MKTSYIASLFLLSATIFVGGCALTQKSNPNPAFTPTVSSTGESVESVTVSSTADEVDVVASDSRPECKRIESDYTDPIFGSYPDWAFRVEAYPIAGKYEHLKTHEPLSIGEGGEDVLARLFTAADCGTEQVERFVGKKMDEKIPLVIMFEVESAPESFLEVLRNGAYGLPDSEMRAGVYAVSPSTTTLQDVANLRFYAEYIKNVIEQG